MVTIFGQEMKKGDVVKFDNIILDKGFNYDPKTGIFNAPLSGLYKLSLTIRVSFFTEKDLHIGIFRNGDQVICC